MTEKREVLYTESTQGNFAINMPSNIARESFKEDILSAINFLSSTILDEETDFFQMETSLQKAVFTQLEEINDDDVSFQKMIVIIKASIYNAIKNHMGAFVYMSESWVKMKREYQDSTIMAKSTSNPVYVMIGNLGVLIR